MNLYVLHYFMLCHFNLGQNYRDFALLKNLEIKLLKKI